MGLVSMRSLMRHALENRYAVGYFESWNMESMLAVVDAAEAERSPVIIGFNGSFIANDDRTAAENIYHYGSMGKAIAENARVPVALLLNEADKVPILVNGLKAGFNAIMYGNPSDSFEETIEINKYLVRTAHYCGADVEAEVGELPMADKKTNTVSDGELTDPDKAAYFVGQTEVDALAVAVGNVHLLEGTKSKLNFELIKLLREKIHVPLVLHGGTGVSEEDLKEAVNLGMCKVNVGTVLKRTFINSIRMYIKNNDIESYDPHDIIGKGGAKDIFSNARREMTVEIIKFIKIIGSGKKADLL